MSLAGDTNLETQDPGGLRDFEVAAGATVYKGSICGVMTTGANVGYVAPIGSQAATFRFVGICAAQVDNANGSNGEKVVECYTMGAFLLKVETGGVPLVGVAAYAANDDEVTDDEAFALVGRTVRGHSATHRWIELIETADQ